MDMTNKLTMTKTSEQEADFTREFDAPRALVFKAFKERELMTHWWGPRSMTMSIQEHDFREGGKYRYTHISPDGNEYVFFGEFKEIAEPEKLTQTFAYEGMSGPPSIDSMTLEEKDDRTIMHGHTDFGSPENLQGMIDQGMEGGMAESYDRLEELLNKRQKTGSWV